MQKVIQIRRGAGRALHKFQQEKLGRVAFIGGSITEMPEGYSFLASNMIREMFPTSRIEFINAGIGSTCSDTGAFRIGRDVFSKGKVDLLFIEFAVNDNQDGHLKPVSTVRAMEGMVRQALANNPEIDIVFLYTANESHIKNLQSGKMPREIRAMEKVAKHYHAASINFAQEVAERIAAGEFNWADDFGGVHPAPFGNEIYCSLIREFLDRSGGQRCPAIPEELIDEHSLINGQLLSPSAANFDDGWCFGIPDWDEAPGTKRERFTGVQTLYSTAPGAKLTLEFQGNCIGFYLTAGPDAGAVRFRIDGGKVRKVKLYHPFSQNLHYPYTKLLAEDLPGGSHTLELEVCKARNPGAVGKAVRIMYFTVNGSN